MENKHKKILKEIIKVEIDEILECIRDDPNNQRDIKFWKNRIKTLKEIDL